MTHRRSRVLASALLATTWVGTSACGSGTSATVLPEPGSTGAAANGRGTARVEPSPAGDGSIPVLGAQQYEVHEWGLMRQGPNDVLDVGAVAPPVRSEPLVVDKPVLYFHSGSPMQLARVEVHASGDIIEHWPLTASGTPRVVAWRGVGLDTARRAGTPACAGSGYPSATEPPCTNLARGETCESIGLGPLAALATCVQVGGTTHPFLFYRSRTRAFTPPLRVVRTASGELRATNTGRFAIPGSVVVIRRRGGGTVAHAFVPPAPQQTSLLTQRAGDDEDDETTADMPVMPSDVEAGRRAVRSTMRGLGLTDGEIDAFLRAWDAQLFERRTLAQNVTTDELALDRRGPITDIPSPPPDAVLYFLPAATCDSVSTLSFEPAPRAVRRALAVWSAVR